MIYKCKCDNVESGFIEIDPKSTNLLCGIRCVVNQANVRLTNGIATCAICGAVIYEDNKEEKK